MKSSSMRLVAQFVFVLLCAAVSAACTVARPTQYVTFSPSRDVVADSVTPEEIPPASRVPQFAPALPPPTNTPLSSATTAAKPCDACEGNACGVDSKPQDAAPLDRGSPDEPVALLIGQLFTWEQANRLFDEQARERAREREAKLLPPPRYIPGGPPIKTTVGSTTLRWPSPTTTVLGIPWVGVDEVNRLSQKKEKQLPPPIYRPGGGPPLKWESRGTFFGIAQPLRAEPVPIPEHSRMQSEQRVRNSMEAILNFMERHPDADINPFSLLAMKALLRNVEYCRKHGIPIMDFP